MTLFSLIVAIASLNFAHAEPAGAKPTEFCNVELPTIQAPFNCTSERKSAETLESMLASYRSVCPGLQERFEALDQERQKLTHRCVVFSTGRKEPESCAADRAATADKLRAYANEAGSILERVLTIEAGIAAQPPADRTCRTFHEQHKLILAKVRERLHNLKAAAERAEKDSRAPAPQKKDHERVVPSKRKD